MTLVEVEINSVSLHEGIITIFGNDVSHSSSDRLERIRTDETEREVTFIFDSHDFKDYEYLSDWLHSQKASKGASTWGEALNSIVGTRTQIASIFRTCWG